MPTEDITVPGGTPDAVAWRLANVEQGLKDTRTEMKDMRQALETKLDGIASGFATHKDIGVAKGQAKLEHEAIYEKINEVEDDVISLRKEVKDEVNFLRKRNWVQNTLSAILGAILAVFVTYFINDILN